MIIAASWLMTYFIHGTVCGVIATALRFLPGSPALRCRVWRFALLSPFATASIAVAANRGNEWSVTPVFASSWSPRQKQSVDVQVIQRHGAPPLRIETRKDSLAATASLIIILFAGVASSAGFMRLAIRRSRTSRRLATRVPCNAGLGLVSSTSMSESVQVPLTLRGGEVCVPPGFTGLSASEQRSVLLHERAHVMRKDPEWLDTARAIAAVLWWQPFNIYVTRRLELDSELAADEMALSHGADGPSLVRALSQFAAALEDGVFAGAALVRSESPLIERAHLILYGARPGRWTRVSYVIVASVTVLLAIAPRVTAERTRLPAVPAGANEVVEETNVILR